jgi:TonB family protein
MKWRLVAAALALLLTAAFAAEAQTDGSQTETAPSIVVRGTDMSRFCARRANQGPRYYPARAVEENKEGRVLLNCTVGADGKMAACQIEEETPPDFGFGRAALGIACRYRHQPNLQAGSEDASRRRVIRGPGDTIPIPSGARSYVDVEGRTHLVAPVNFRLP